MKVPQSLSLWKQCNKPIKARGIKLATVGKRGKSEQYKSRLVKRAPDWLKAKTDLALIG